MEAGPAEPQPRRPWAAFPVSSCTSSLYCIVMFLWPGFKFSCTPPPVLETFNSSVHQSDNIQIGSVLEKLPSQKTLSSILDDNLFRVLQGSLSIADRARLLSASSPHASSWLTVIPSEGQGLHLDPPVFQTALKWWLGLDTAEGSVCALCPDKMLDPLGHHATTCKRGGDVVFRHNRLRDILAETCK